MPQKDLLHFLKIETSSKSANVGLIPPKPAVPSTPKVTSHPTSITIPSDPIKLNELCHYLLKQIIEVYREKKSLKYIIDELEISTLDIQYLLQHDKLPDSYCSLSHLNDLKAISSKKYQQIIRRIVASSQTTDTQVIVRYSQYPKLHSLMEHIRVHISSQPGSWYRFRKETEVARFFHFLKIRSIKDLLNFRQELFSLNSD